MTFKKFKFIWRNIHLMEPRVEVLDDESDDEGETVYNSENNVHYVVRNDDDENDFHFDQKARSIIDLTNQGNKLICHFPS